MHKQFDLFSDSLDDKFKFIYSIAVLHMFVLDEHRDLFYKFIYEHLSNDGYCLISVLGDGKKEYVSDITTSFDERKRVVMNTGVMLDVVSTSCRIVNFSNLEKELRKNKLQIKEKWISNKIPEFSSSICIVITKNDS